MITVTHTGAVSTAHGGFKVGAFTGTIYLGDIGRRNGLGGGVSVYGNGQDRYLKLGTPIQLVETSDVLLSQAKGVLKKLVDLGLVSIT